jgi:mRNA interferase RelE/StbE
VSQYTVHVTPDALHEIERLPGNVRQRVKRAIDGLADDPHPPSSKTMTVPDIESEVCRLRLDKWRVVYAVSEAERIVDVVAVRKRPPYDYGDLARLLADMV